MKKNDGGQAFGQWFPIESAPSDGREVLVYDPNRGARVATCKESSGCGMLWYPPGDIRPLYPTHWMPLPPPPAKDQP